MPTFGKDSATLTWQGTCQTCPPRAQFVTELDISDDPAKPTTNLQVHVEMVDGKYHLFLSQG